MADSDAPRPRAIRTATLANLGCKVNQSEIDRVERLLRRAGVRLVGLGEAADIVVVNTCAVTGVADQKSRHAVRRATRTNPEAVTFVTGCSAQLDAAAFTSIAPDIRLFGNDAKAGLSDELAGLLGCAPDVDAATDAHVDAGDGDRIERTRAFVKVQDGCSFHCTYCIVPRARGEARSVPREEIVADVRAALAAGHREVVLSGINIGTYDGEPAEPDDAVGLAGLAGAILAETPIERIRLSSVEPQHVTPELLEVWASSGGRCLPHFHVPLQSGDDTILRRMGRRYRADDYERVVAAIRSHVPDAAIHADVIAGFPGEDETAWSNTLDRVRRLDLAGLHVFRFSARAATPAERMAGQVDGVTKKRRAAQALALAAELRLRFAERQLGRDLEVLFESPLPDGRWLGHAGNYLEVAVSGDDLGNEIGLVRAESVDVEGRVTGRVLELRPRPPVTERAAAPAR